MAEIHWILSLAGFAALIRYAQAFTAERETRPPWEWRVASIHVGTGTFVGLLASFAIGPSWEPRYVYVAVALAGYGGKLTLDAGWEILRQGASTVFARAAQRLADEEDLDKSEKG